MKWHVWHYISLLLLTLGILRALYGSLAEGLLLAFAGAAMFALATWDARLRRRAREARRGLRS